VSSSHAHKLLAQEMVDFLGLNYDIKYTLCLTGILRHHIRYPYPERHENVNSKTRTVQKIYLSFPIGVFAISRASNRLFTIKGIVCYIMHSPQLRIFPIQG
jgi:hypothetical protein